MSGRGFALPGDNALVGRREPHKAEDRQKGQSCQPRQQISRLSVEGRIGRRDRQKAGKSAKQQRQAQKRQQYLIEQEFHHRQIPIFHGRTP